MRKYILKRLVELIPIILGITLMSFAFMRAASGDVVDAMYENAGTTASAKVMAEKREELGLNKPFIVQYGDWLYGMFKGDMGVSFVSGEEVTKVFMSHLPATLFLGCTSLLLTVLISIPLGHCVGSKTQWVNGLRHKIIWVYRKFYARIFCVSAFDLFFFPSVEMAACYGKHSGMERDYIA